MYTPGNALLSKLTPANADATKRAAEPKPLRQPGNVRAAQKECPNASGRALRPLAKGVPEI